MGADGRPKNKKKILHTESKMLKKSVITKNIGNEKMDEYELFCEKTFRDVTKGGITSTADVLEAVNQLYGGKFCEEVKQIYLNKKHCGT